MMLPKKNHYASFEGRDTHIITSSSIAACPIRLIVILVTMSVSTFKTAAILYVVVYNIIELVNE